MHLLTNLTELKAFKVVLFLILGSASLLRVNCPSFPSNQNDIDSLQQLLISVPDNSPSVLTLIKLSDIFTNLDTGIPTFIRDKIVQLFFTIKPAGQGTGLGLSLANDIVKAHGGKIEVNTLKIGGTEFKIIILS